MSESTETLSNEQIAALELSDWRVLQFPLYARFATGDFATGLKLVDAIAAAAERRDHHPDIDLRYDCVQVSVVSHDVGGRTQRDIDLAREISGIAADLGVRADPAALTVVEFGIDTWDAAEILPFWRAVYGVEGSDDEVSDPAGLLPAIWVQGTERHDTPRQRWHPDIWVAPDHAQARIDAAVAAGGTIVGVEDTFTVLADRQGNKACICVSEGR